MYNFLDSDASKLENRFRSCIKPPILACDVTAENMVPELRERPLDGVVSTLCLEAACSTLSEYESAVQKIADLLKSGGYLIFLVVLKELYYVVGENKFAVISLVENDVLSALQKAGIQEEHVIPQKRLSTDKSDLGDSDFEGALVVLGKKL